MLSDELKSYCYEKVYELAKIYEMTLTARMEYGECFFHVMSILNVPQDEQERMLSIVKYHSELNGIPYYKLSPVNQFIMSVGPYIWYCLITNPPKNMSSEEADQLINSEEFTMYLNQLSPKISQQIKGALWKPGFGCLGKSATLLLFGFLLIIGIFLIIRLI